jgi:uncharacterized membrane protein
MLVLRLVTLLLAALVTGVYWGPWVAVTRTLKTLEPPLLLPLVRHLSSNLRPLMTVLMPVTLVAIAVQLTLEWGSPRRVPTLGAFVLYVVTLVVTATIEVPIVKQLESYTLETLPSDWQQKRDRWMRFHLLRVVPGIMGLALLGLGAMMR